MTHNSAVGGRRRGRKGPSVSWTIIDNPAFAGQAPRPLTPACHDGSPFLTIRCGCGADMHLHKTQIDAAPPGVTIGARCPACRNVLKFGDELRRTFADMREAGWYGGEAGKRGAG